MSKKDLITIVILLIISAFIALLIFIIKDEEVEIKKETEFNKLTLLTDETTFLSISDAINKVCEYATSESDLVDYILKEEINIEDYKYTSFRAEEIYVISKSNLYKYYIKGNLYEEIMDELPKYIRQEYFVLNYDINSSRFNIEVINQKKYNDIKLIEHKFENIDKNNYNIFEYNVLGDKERVILYYNDFLEKIISSPIEAYDLLTEDTKEYYFKEYRDFEDFINNNFDDNIKEYSVNSNQIGIKDTNGNEYVFNISYPLKYTVDIYKTEE